MKQHQIQMRLIRFMVAKIFLFFYFRCKHTAVKKHSIPDLRAGITDVRFYPNPLLRFFCIFLNCVNDGPSVVFLHEAQLEETCNTAKKNPAPETEAGFK